MIMDSIVKFDQSVDKERVIFYGLWMVIELIIRPNINIYKMCYFWCIIWLYPLSNRID
jgi:hypothetical protein